MAISFKTSSASFESPAVGLDEARIIGVIDIGTQDVAESQFWPATQKHQLIIKVELPNQLRTEGDNEGQPFTMDKWFTASMHEKASFKKFIDMLGIPEENFSESMLIGKTVSVDINASDEGKTFIKSFSKVSPKITVPEQISEPIIFSIDETQDFTKNDFTDLPEYLQKTIKKSKEFNNRVQTKTVPLTVDDFPETKTTGETVSDKPFR